MENGIDYFKILDDLGDGIICIDDKDSIVYINKKAKDILGYEYLNSFPKHILEIFDIRTKNSGQIIMKIIDEIRNSGFARGLDYCSYLFDAFNDKRYISASLSLIEINEINHIVINFRDITILKKLEIESAEQKGNLESIYNSIPIGIAVVDYNRRVIQINHFMKKTFILEEDNKTPKFLGNMIKCSNASSTICGYGESCKGCILKESIDNIKEKNDYEMNIKTKIKHKVANKEMYKDYQISLVKISQKNQRRILVSIQDLEGVI